MENHAQPPPLSLCVDRSPQVHRLSGALEPITAPSADDPEVVAVELGPGDVLYHPGGIWHQVECGADEDSVSINLSLFALTWAELAGRLLTHCLWREEATRAMICVAPNVSAADRTARDRAVGRIAAPLDRILDYAKQVRSGEESGLRIGVGRKGRGQCFLLRLRSHPFCCRARCCCDRTSGWWWTLGQDSWSAPGNSQTLSKQRAHRKDEMRRVRPDGS